MKIIYNRTNWKNRVVERPRTYTQITNSDGSRTDSPAPKTVVQAGTPLNETNLNNIEQGIQDCVDAINAMEAAKPTEEQRMKNAETAIANNARAITDVQRVNETQSNNIEALTKAHNALAEDVGKVEENIMDGDVGKHIRNRSNPHVVTKAQVGLSEVPNVSTNNQTPTYTEATSNSNLVSGEKLSTAFGKIARAVKNLWTHIADRTNPHGVTKTQVGLGNVPNVTTNAQTPTFTEATADSELVSGETLALAFGKLAHAVKALWAHIDKRDNPHEVDYFETMHALFPEYAFTPDKVAYYTGDGNTQITVNGQKRNGQYIDVGFAPSKVAILCMGAEVTPGMTESQAMKLEEMAVMHKLTGGALIAPGRNYCHSGCGGEAMTCRPEQLLNYNHGGAAVYSNGFVVQTCTYGSSGYPNANDKGVRYIYFAWK